MQDNTPRPEAQPYHRAYRDTAYLRSNVGSRGPTLPRHVYVHISPSGWLYVEERFWPRSHWWWRASDFYGFVPGISPHAEEYPDVVCEPVLSSLVYEPEGAIVDVTPLY